MSDTPTVEMPAVQEAAPVEEILEAIVTRLESIAAVLEGETKWLQPKVTFFRKMDDDGIAHDLSIGYIDAAEVAEKRAEDNLILQRKNVDRHLENVQVASLYIRDIVLTMQNEFGVSVALQAASAGKVEDGAE